MSQPHDKPATFGRRREDHLSLNEQMQQNPWNWKDGLALFGLLLTLATVVLQGGKVLERLDATNQKLTALSAQMGALQNEQIRLSTDVTGLRGVDRLHEEQINTLRRDVDSARAARKAAP
jgi:outer membrane murein-binding lipoprotein Lpp